MALASNCKCNCLSCCQTPNGCQQQLLQIGQSGPCLRPASGCPFVGGGLGAGDCIELWISTRKPIISADAASGCGQACILRCNVVSIVAFCCCRLHHSAVPCAHYWGLAPYLSLVEWLALPALVTAHRHCTLLIRLSSHRYQALCQRVHF